MQYLYPEQYGDGIPWAEQGEGAFGSLEGLLTYVLHHISSNEVNFTRIWEIHLCIISSLLHRFDSQHLTIAS